MTSATIDVNLNSVAERAALRAFLDVLDAAAVAAPRPPAAVASSEAVRAPTPPLALSHPEEEASPAAEPPAAVAVPEPGPVVDVPSPPVTVAGAASPAADASSEPAAERLRRPPAPAGWLKPLPDRTFLDPRRPMTDGDRVRAWDLAGDGYRPSQIARHLSRDLKQVDNYIRNVRNGNSSVPRRPAESTALVKTSDRSLVVGVLPVSVDPEMAVPWKDDLAERQINGFVRRELYPAEGQAR